MADGRDPAGPDDDAVQGSDAAPEGDATPESDATPEGDAAPDDGAVPGADTASDADAAAGDAVESSADADGAASSLSAVTGSIGSGAKTLLGPLVASKLRIVLLLLVGLVALVGAGVFLGVLGAPGVAGVENSFGNVSQNQTVVETNLTVKNPNPVGVSLGGVTIDYDVEMNDVQMANGTKEGISIGTGNSTMHLETAMFNDRIPPWWVSHIQNREYTDVAIDATVASSTLGQSKTFTREREIQTDVLGQFASQEDRQIDANQPVLSDPFLVVRETEASWGNVDREETPLNMRFRLYNPPPEPFTVTELRYEVTMNDLVVSRGATDEEVVMAPGSEDTLTATANIQNQRLDEWWVSHLDDSVYGHQVTRFQIDFTAVVEVGGEEVVVPLDELTYAEWIGTDLFSEGGDVGVPPQEDPETDDGIVGEGGPDGSGGTDGGDSGGTDGSGSDGSDDTDGSDSGGDDSSGDGDDGIVDGDGPL